MYREKNPLDNHYVKLTSNHYNRIQVNVKDGKFRTYVTAEIVFKFIRLNLGKLFFISKLLVIKKSTNGKDQQ